MFSQQNQTKPAQDQKKSQNKTNNIIRKEEIILQQIYPHLSMNQKIHNVKWQVQTI